MKLSAAPIQRAITHEDSPSSPDSVEDIDRQHYGQFGKYGGRNCARTREELNVLCLDVAGRHVALNRARDGVTGAAWTPRSNMPASRSGFVQVRG